MEAQALARMPETGTGRRIAEWAARLDEGLLALLALPWLLLALDPNCLVSRLGFPNDVWFYFGYYLDLGRKLATAQTWYPSSRLSMIVPGWIAHSLLSPLWANYLLHLSLWYGSVFSLYAILKLTIGPRPAFLAAFAMGCNAFFLAAVGWDYCDAFGITYLLLSMLLLTRAALGRGGAWSLVGAGVCAAAMVVANTGYALLGPFLVTHYLAVRRAEARRSLAVVAAMFTLGGVGLIGVLGLFNAYFTGNFWFLASTLKFLEHGQELFAPFWQPWQSWLPWAGHLFLPCWCLASGLLCLLWSWLLPSRRLTRLGVYYQLQLLGCFLIFLGYDVARKHIFLQFACYASMLMPFAYLALGAQLQGLSERLDRFQYGLLLGAVAALLLVPVPLLGTTWILTMLVQAFASWSFPPWFLLAVIPGGLALLAFQGSVPKLCRAIVLFYLLSIGQYLVHLSIEDLSPIMPMEQEIAAVQAQKSTWGIPGAKWRYRDAAGNYNPAEFAALHLYNRHRCETLQAMAETLRAVQSLGLTDDLVVWYDMADPHGYLYDWCKYLFFFNQSNPDFPHVHEGDLIGGGRMQAGRRVVVLTAIGRDALAEARAGLGEIGLDARLVGTKAVRAPGIEFNVTYLELVPCSSGKSLAMKKSSPET